MTDAHNESQPPVSIIAYRNDLKSVVGNALPKVSFVARRKLLRTWKRVLVESAPCGVNDSVFFASHPRHEQTCPVATQVLGAHPHNLHDVVYQHHDFEISFIGMSVSPQDTVAFNNNELLLYSLSAQHPVVERRNDSALDQAQLTSPPLFYTHSTGFELSPADVPFIHFDPIIDAHDSGNEADAFVPISASKALYLRSKGSQTSTHNEKTVSIRFSLLELDTVSEMQIRAVAGIGDVGNVIESGVVAAPYLKLVSSAFKLASVLGKKALQNYSKPDHVLSKDIEFKLGTRRQRDDEETTSGMSEEEDESEDNASYLRYGYYFFLSKTVDAKLYAQVGSSSQHVPLLLKREDLDSRAASKNEKLYFPLTGVSYVVAKVSRGVSHRDPADREQLRTEHRKRLDTMLHMGPMMEMISSLDGVPTPQPSRKRNKTMKKNRGTQ